jgi:DNA-directed RNA polymerase subunit RPC12/RpoP
MAEIELIKDCPTPAGYNRCPSCSSPEMVFEPFNKETCFACTTCGFKIFIPGVDNTAVLEYVIDKFIFDNVRLAK